MKWRRRGRAGLSLVELLVVLGVIAILTAVAIPTLARSGWFTSNKSALGARELFTMLRAAKVYATTYNVDTAVAYGMRLVTDSQTGALVPVVDSVVLSRALTRDEVKTLRLRLNPTSPLQTLLADGEPVFVPLRGREGVFRTLPNDTCVLPDLFQVPGPSGFSSETGLADIRLLDLSTAPPTVIRPRTVSTAVDPDGNLDYQLSGLPQSFPAHRFATDGSLDVPEVVKPQRFRIRVGMLPDRDPSERFFVNPNEAVLEGQPFWSIHHEGTPNDAVETTWVVDVEGQRRVDIATGLLLYRPTGRVKIES